MGSLIAICRLDREVLELSVTHPDGDPIEQMVSVVQMLEDEILEWERTRTVHSDSAAETCSDLAQELTGQELVEVLEKILAEAQAAEWPEPGQVDTDCTRQVLQQATKVSYGEGDLRQLDQGRLAALRLQQLPVGDKAGDQTLLHLFRQPGRRGSGGASPEKGQGVAGKGTQGYREGQGSHRSASAGGYREWRNQATWSSSRPWAATQLPAQRSSRGEPTLCRAGRRCDPVSLLGMGGRPTNCLQRICGGVTEVADRPTHSEASAAGDNGRTKRAPEAASGFPPDLTLQTRRGGTQQPCLRRGQPFPRCHPWRRTTRGSMR